MSIKNLQNYEQVKILFQTIKWFFIAAIVGILAGTASAGFLALLDWVTNWRESHLWIIGFLPLGGLLIGWIYHRFGQDIERGSNLLIDEIHDPKKVVSFRMAPIIFFSAIASHFFGASVGREGAAVQMGGSLADQLTHLLRLKSKDRLILLMAGISAGFASIIGTPLAGAIFGLEVLVIGKVRYDAIFPCFLAAIVGEQVALAWGAHHTAYQIASVPAEISMMGLTSAILAGAIFGIVGMLFAKTTHQVGNAFKKLFPNPLMRPFMGGIILAIAVWVIGTTKYIGLGIPTIKAAFDGTVPPYDFVGKFAFTALSLGSGFKGGEVVPLFFIGATLGNLLSYILSLPAPLLAGMGFVAVFAGASNTPLASTLIALELFGPKVGAYAGVACIVSYLFSGHTGIYHSQRVGINKHRTDAE